MVGDQAQILLVLTALNLMLVIALIVVITRRANNKKNYQDSALL
jgi:hypothetical protein